MPKDIWISEKWMKNPDIYHSGRRTGLRMRYDKEIDPEVKLLFRNWSIGSVLGFISRSVFRYMLGRQNVLRPVMVICASVYRLYRTVIWMNLI